ncbi:hypothetical protein AKJ16_DCAP03645 [Drosera capensis]
MESYARKLTMEASPHGPRPSLQLSDCSDRGGREGGWRPPREREGELENVISRIKALLRMSLISLDLWVSNVLREKVLLTFFNNIGLERMNLTKSSQFLNS